MWSESEVPGLARLEIKSLTARGDVQQQGYSPRLLKRSDAVERLIKPWFVWWSRLVHSLAPLGSGVQRAGMCRVCVLEN